MIEEPKTGDMFLTNGVEVVVHFVEDGQVYGVRYLEGSSDESLEWGEIPEGFLGTFRMKLEDWDEAIKDAKHVRVSEAI